ncbi:MAG: hypothetical protein QXU74_00270 [Candidatus Aenigmatarchaeota archaeon]
MKDYTIWDEKGFGQLPQKINLLDSNIFIGAVRCYPDCWRIVESQDNSTLKFGIAYGTEKEIIKCLIKKYNGLGCSWVYNILKNRNFIRIRLDKKLIKNKEKYGSVDGALLTLAKLNEVENIVSLDSHLSKDRKFIRPFDFVIKYGNELIKLDEKWREFKKGLEEERERLKTKEYSLEDFEELWIVPYDY